jgi:hypothetical protein
MFQRTVQKPVSSHDDCESNRAHKHRIRPAILTGTRLGRVKAQQITTKDQGKIALVIGELQTAQDLHQNVNLASDGGSTRF